MMKKSMTIQIIFIFLIIILLTSCFASKTAVENQIKDGDFQAVISIDKVDYEMSEDIKVNGYLLYLGELSNILVHSSKISELRVFDKTGNIIFSEGKNDISLQTEVNKGESIKINYSETLTKLNILEPGKYEIVISFEFYINDKSEKILLLEPKLEINIEEDH